MLLRTPVQTTLTPPLVIEAAGQRYKQTAQYLCLAALPTKTVTSRSKLTDVRLLRTCLKQFGPESYDRTIAPLSLKVRMLTAEVIETLLYGCVTWTLRVGHFAKLRTAHHQVLLRVIGFHRRVRIDDTILSYTKPLKMIRCESTETTIRKRWLCFAGAAALLNKERLPSRAVYGTMAGGENPRPGGQYNKTWQKDG